jgi:hypothetical protein
VVHREVVMKSLRFSWIVLLVVGAAGCARDVTSPSSSLNPSSSQANLGSMNVGDVRVLTFAQAQSGLTIPSSASSARYVVVAANVAGDAGPVPNFTITGDWNAVTGSLGPASLAAGVFRPHYSSVGGPRGMRFIAGLRSYEHTRLQMPRPPGRTPLLSLRADRVPSGVVPTVGSQYEFNVPGGSGDVCTNFSTVTATVEKVSAHAIIVTDNRSLTSGLTAASYDSIANEFDTYVYPTEVGYYGTPTDIDDNGHVFILFSPAVNLLTPAGTAAIGGYVGGFTFAGDFFPATSEASGGCPESNQGEIFYLLAPDPTGLYGNTFTLPTVREVARSTIAHEMQHVINAGNRYVNDAPAFESAWLDEALSSLAEDDVGRAELGMADLKTLTLNDITAMDSVMFDTFFSGNFARAKIYVLDPDTIGAIATDTRVEGSLAAFGAGWAFLRYIVDWFSGNAPRTLTQQLVAGPDTGLVNLTATTGAPLDTLLSRWLVTMYTDGQSIPGLGAQYNYRSYNLRDILSALCLDPNCSGPQYLPVTALGSANTSVTVGIPSSSADYFTVGDVGSGARTIHILEPGGSSSTFVYGRLYVIRVG